MKIEDFITRTDELLSQGQDVLNTRRSTDWGDRVDEGQFHGFRSACLSFLMSTFGKHHPYYEEFNSEVKENRPSHNEKGIGVLYAVKNELEGGWIRTTKGLVSAEIFSDFLEMASHLLEEGYKDPAAVMIGTVLEEHLRNLCVKFSVETHVEKNEQHKPKKASLLNAELAKAGAYSKLDEKAIISWLDLRNKAAHGKYDEYSKEQVSLMSQSVTEFMVRVSA